MPGERRWASQFEHNVLARHRNALVMYTHLALKDVAQAIQALERAATEHNFISAALGRAATGNLVLAWAALWGTLAGVFVFAGLYLFVRSLAAGSVSTNASIFRLNFIVTAFLAICILGFLASTLLFLLRDPPVRVVRDLAHFHVPFLVVRLVELHLGGVGVGAHLLQCEPRQAAVVVAGAPLARDPALLLRAITTPIRDRKSGAEDHASIMPVRTAMRVSSTALLQPSLV